MARAGLSGRVTSLVGLLLDAGDDQLDISVKLLQETREARVITKATLGELVDRGLEDLEGLGSLLLALLTDLLEVFLGLFDISTKLGEDVGVEVAVREASLSEKGELLVKGLEEGGVGGCGGVKVDLHCWCCGVVGGCVGVV